MKLTDGSLRNPAAVVVVVALVIALGIFSLTKLPFQLFPDIEEPQMTIFTGWRAAAPAEVESELIEPQEAALQGLQGLKQLNAFANAGGSWINLRFNVGTDMQKALIDVISRMNQLPSLPRDAVILRQDETYILRVTPGSKVERVPVSTGIGSDGLIEVKGKVTAGDRVIVCGGERLQPGQSVSVIEG